LFFCQREKSRSRKKEGQAKKDDKTLKEAKEMGLTLLTVPRRPTVLPMTEPYIDVERAPVEWKPFIAA